MLCQRCGKYKATSHLTQIINGEKTELHLCSKCAKEIDGTFPSLFGESIFGDVFNDMFFGNQLVSEKVCPHCGMTLSTLKNQGRVGCASCYDEFSDILLPYINKIQGVQTHILEKNQIKQESQLKEEPEKELSEKEKLQNELNEAIKKEDYERAIVIRDKIKELFEGD